MAEEKKAEEKKKKKGRHAGKNDSDTKPESAAERQPKHGLARRKNKRGEKK